MSEDSTRRLPVADAPTVPEPGEPSFPDRVVIADEPATGAGPRYEPHEVLGAGGMGDVRVCRDRRIAREVMAAAFAAGLATHLVGVRGWLLSLCACLPILLPLALEWSGLAPPSHAFEDGRLVLFQRVVDLPAGAGHAFLLGTALATVVSVVHHFGVFRERLLDADRQRELQAGHLKQRVADEEAQTARRS